LQGQNPKPIARTPVGEHVVQIFAIECFKFLLATCLPLKFPLPHFPNPK